MKLTFKQRGKFWKQEGDPVKGWAKPFVINPKNILKGWKDLDWASENVKIKGIKLTLYYSKFDTRNQLHLYTKQLTDKQASVLKGLAFKKPLKIEAPSPRSTVLKPRVTVPVDRPLTITSGMKMVDQAGVEYEAVAVKVVHWKTKKPMVEMRWIKSGFPKRKPTKAGLTSGNYVSIKTTYAEWDKKENHGRGGYVTKIGYKWVGKDNMDNSMRHHGRTYWPARDGYMNVAQVWAEVNDSYWSYKKTLYAPGQFYLEWINDHSGPDIIRNSQTRQFDNEMTMTDGNAKILVRKMKAYVKDLRRN